MLARLESHRIPLAALAFGIASATLALVASWAGWRRVRHVVAATEPRWLVVGAAAQVLALLGYAIAYRRLVTAEGGPRLTLAMTARVVTAGFGAFAIGGGFAIDQRVLRGAGATPDDAAERVLGLGALEYAVLAPVACVCAAALLRSGARIGGGVLWPWVIGVPAGGALALLASSPQVRERCPRRGRARTATRRMLEGVGWTRTLGARPLRNAHAWLGMALYWAADIATLYAAIRLFGAQLGLARIVVAYATGYVATRRTLPLGGVGATELLLCLALHWVGLPLAQAVAAVGAYRLGNLALTLLPAAGAHASLRTQHTG